MLREDVPPAVGEAIARMLAKKPADRFQTPGEIAEMLAPSCVGAELPLLVPSPVDVTDADTVPPSAETPSAETPFAEPLFAEADHSNTPDWQRALTQCTRISAHPARRWSRRFFVTLGVLLGFGTATYVARDLWQRRPARSTDSTIEEFQIHSFDVHCFRLDEQSDTAVPAGRIGQDVFFAAQNDHIRLSAELNGAAYACVMAFNPDGSIQQFDNDKTRRRSITFPADPQQFFQLTDGPGQQVLAVIVSRVEIPEIRDGWIGQTRVPWTHSTVTGVWSFDGEHISALAESQRQKRGLVVARSATAFQILCEFLKRELHADDIEALAFSVK